MGALRLAIWRTRSATCGPTEARSKKNAAAATTRRDATAAIGKRAAPRRCDAPFSAARLLVHAPRMSAESAAVARASQAPRERVATITTTDTVATSAHRIRSVARFIRLASQTVSGAVMAR